MKGSGSGLFEILLRHLHGGPAVLKPQYRRRHGRDSNHAFPKYMPELELTRSVKFPLRKNGGISRRIQP
jgi:hypothetical protein